MRSTRRCSKGSVPRPTFTSYDDADPTVWLIANLHVRPASRRSGIGTQSLFDAAFDTARAHATAPCVTLWVWRRTCPPGRSTRNTTCGWTERHEAMPRSGVAVDLIRYVKDVERPVFRLR